ncbi:eukaryotic translation initiation factor 2 subunit beta [Verticillium dahliae]|nr:eukaryotic translation initiation factor 2 subunit beta [Verticillium dahliae]
MEETALPDRKQRKSVAFSSEEVVVDADGSVTMVNSPDETKDSAQSHTPRTPPLAAALEAFTDPLSEAAAVDDAAPAGDDAPAADGGLDLTMKKKKKKKVVKEDDEAGDAAAEDGGLDLSMKKEEEEGSSTLSQKNPDHALSGTKSYKIPPPQCVREGNKKTIFANIAEIAKRMKRTDEHVTQYLFSELGTSGSVDGSRRLVIKGRFQQKQIENVLRKYIIEYVTCKTCKSPNTELNKGENRLYFVNCNNCGSRRTVTAIKTGFSAQIGKRRCRVKRPALDVVSSLLAVLAVLACSFSCTCYRFSVDWDAT